MTREESNLSSLPKGWAWVRLGEIAEVGQGGTPSTSKREYWKGGIPWLRSGEVNFNRITKSCETITEMGLKNSPAKLLPKGTVLLAMTGEGLTRGRAAILEIEASANQSCAHMILDSRVAKGEYLFYYFRKEYWNIRQMDKGTNQPGLNTSIIKKFLIPFAPLNEQVRIVGRVEELFSVLDAGVESLRKVKAQLKRYRQAVLKYAFEGKLTKEWRKTHKDQIEPTQKSLQEIREERIRKGLGQWKTVDATDVKGLPEIPNHWIWVRAQEVCENITNGYTPPSSELHNSSGEIPFIKVNNLTFTGKLDFSKNKTFIDRKLHETMLRRSRVFPGDVLMNIVGPPLGKVSIAPNLYPEWNINQAIVFFRPIKGYDKDLLALCLQTNIITTYLTKQAKATAGQFNISVNMSRNLPIPLPPKEEQEKIVSEVRKGFDAMEHVELLVNEAMSKADHLRSSVLKAAFTGTLVPQDPNDEPAEKLLERTKSERTKTKSKSLGSINRKKPNNVEQVELSRYAE